MKIKKFTLYIFLLAIVPFSGYGQFDLHLEQIANGYTKACDIVNAGDDRLFVVSQLGTVQIVYGDGSSLSTPFLNIVPRVESGENEQGLLGLAFPPDYCTSGQFYVNYTHTAVSTDSVFTRISRFFVDPNNENLGMPDSEEILMEYYQPYDNHNGGQLEFGPDGYLYIGAGDGGSGGDPENRAQNLQSLLGKLMRIDVSTQPYSIPSDNPFVDNDFALDEIWATGLRNPWKFAFDKTTGDLYIADVGQQNIEEVNFVAAGSPNGKNFGWRCYEGTASYNMSQCDSMFEETFPVFEYMHGAPDNHCSITGGRVYRGSSFPTLFGKYIFVDYCSGDYWVLWQDDEGEWQNFAAPDLGGNITAFGSDIYGELYTVTRNGTVSRVMEGDEEIQGPITFNGTSTLISNITGASYEWYFNGALIAGENSQTINIGVNGVYSVIVTTSAGCTLDSEEIEVTAVSVSDHPALEKFVLFPNPAKAELSIELESTTYADRTLLIDVLDIRGKLVNTLQVKPHSALNQFTISELNAGIYLLQLRDGSGLPLGVRKLVVE